MTRPSFRQLGNALVSSAMLVGLLACQAPVGGDALPATASVGPATSPSVEADEPTDADTPAATITSHWQCGDLRVAAIPGVDHGSMALSFSGRTLALPKTTSSPGADFSDPAGNRFEPTHSTASLTLAGQPPRACTRTDQPSPWFDAAERGIAFRAVGSEPGWFVEVTAGDAPRLHATLDYGERTIEVTNAVALDGDAFGYHGTATDGNAVVLRLRHEACADGMSGEQFEASAQLTVGQASYRGCGAFLAD